MAVLFTTSNELNNNSHYVIKSTTFNI